MAFCISEYVAKSPKSCGVVCEAANLVVSLGDTRKETMMLKVFLTTDPQTRRALYDDEAKLLGVFQSISEAEEALGDMLAFCTIRSEGKEVQRNR